MYTDSFSGLKDEQIILTCQSLTCNELRQMLRESALPTDGRKAVLVQRVLQNTFPSPLSSFVPAQASVLRDKITLYFYKKRGMREGRTLSSAVNSILMRSQPAQNFNLLNNELNMLNTIGVNRQNQIHVVPAKKTTTTTTRQAQNTKKVNLLFENVLIHTSNDDGTLTEQNCRVIDLNGVLFADPFYTKQDELFHFSALMNERHRFDQTKRFVTVNFSFKTNMHGYHIFSNSDVGVYLRIFCVDKHKPNSAPLIDTYPSHLTVTVNKSAVKIPNAYLKLDKLPKRPHIPIGITGKCSYSPTSTNECIVSFLHDESVIVCASVVVLKKVDLNHLLENTQTTLDASYWSRKILDKYFNATKNKNDDDIVLAEDTIEKDKVLELTCPISLTRMAVPARSVYCTHLRCFDLVNFLQINEKKPLWRCVLCEQFIPLNKIYRDPLYMNIINRTDAHVRQVFLCEIPEDYARIGEFEGFVEHVETVTEQRDSSYCSGEEQEKSKIEVIVIDSD